MAAASLTFSGNGKKLTQLLCEAAGVEGHKVRSIRCRAAVGEPIVFDVEFFGDEEKIGKAMEAVDVTDLRQPVKHWQGNGG